MSTIYIGNASKQRFIFEYWLPESKRRVSLEIPIGTQVKLAGNLTMKDIDAIIEQHRKYGLISETEIERTRVFCGICYATDRPISVRKLTVLMGRNEQVLVSRGQEVRKRLALAVNDQLQTNLESGRRPETMKNFDLSVIENEPKGGYRDDIAAPVAETVQVAAGSDSEGAPRQRRQRRQAAPPMQ